MNEVGPHPSQYSTQLQQKAGRLDPVDRPSSTPPIDVMNTGRDRSSLAAASILKAKVEHFIDTLDQRA
jgi:hypothetical protein